ncbi:hypothetical protein N0V91_009304 [Didymella pomorum]|uniref:Uncharacterized protein n=1 Tax=Didymella pomorum TaxID=749634 RepID=A0A9W8Z7I3_9PLEO|nr:hypothetical protein N0V91_009304 [Didymella pomorum]
MNPECTHYEYNRMTSIQRLSAYITCQSQHHHLSLIVFHSIENSRPLAKSRRSQQSASVIGLRSPSSNAVFMMGTSLMSRTALTLLILHALLNIAQGVYCITHPAAWLELAPDAFQGSPNAAVQAIGLGALGIGWYQLVFAWQAEHATGLLNADMDPHYSIIAAPVYSPIPIYTFDEDKVWEDEVSPIPPLFMNGGKNFVIDPLAWLLYVIEEETDKELIEFEMQDDK